MTGSGLSNVDVAVSTCARHPQYVHRMLDSLLSSGEKVRLRLMVCGLSGEYLGSWNDHADVVPMTDKEWALAESVPPEGRCLLNFRRVIGEDDGPLLAFEDDVGFAPDWAKRLSRAIEALDDHFEIHPQRYRPWVLCLYSPRPFKPLRVNGIDPHHFYGNQALYFSSKARRLVREHIDGKLSRGYPAPADMMVRGAAEAGLVKLFAVVPNACQHIGEVSSLGLNFHRSPTFQ